MANSFNAGKAAGTSTGEKQDHLCKSFRPNTPKVA